MSETAGDYPPPGYPEPEWHPGVTPLRTFTVRVAHPLDDLRAVDVTIKARDWDDHQGMAREKLRITDYPSYCFVTQYPEPPPSPIGLEAMRYSVEVRHERHQWQAACVDIEAEHGTDPRELVRLAREHLRLTDYATYCFVTEHPEHDPNPPSVWFPVPWMDRT